MKEKILKVILIIMSLGVMLAIGIVIGANIKHELRKPAMKLVVEDKNQWQFVSGDLAYMVEANYWNYIHASYILIGNPPDCQYYKIAAGVPRNDYDVELFFTEPDGRMYYHGDDGSVKSKVVMDVSEYQPSIDWDIVKNQGINAVMLRAGYRGYGQGTLVTDSKFELRLEKATEAGMKVGLYFFTQAMNYEEGAEEARYVLSLIDGYSIDYPITIDTEYLEVPEARTYDLDNEARTDGIVGFCETIKAAGYTPMIYSNRNWFVTNLDMSRLGEYKIWLAQYSNQPDFPYMYTGWQYTSEGQVPGVEGYVDLNVWLE